VDWEVWSDVSEPTAMGIDLGTTSVVAHDYGDGTITPLNIANGECAGPISVAKRPWAIAFTAVGR